MSALPLSVRKQYWRSLTRQDVIPYLRLYPHIVEELRAALRDALQEIPEIPCREHISSREQPHYKGYDGKPLCGTAC